MRHGHYEAWISCAGSRLPEFEVSPEGDDGKTLGGYIPSESGKTFSIEVTNGDEEYSIDVDIQLDGTTLPVAYGLDPEERRSLRGVTTSMNSMQPFMFSQLQTTDDDEVSCSSDLSHLGDIHVKITRTFNELREIPWEANTFTGVGVVHEKAKKIVTQSVALGDPVPVDEGTQYESIPVDPSEGAAAVFIFRYRPLAMLQAQDIAPAAPKREACPDSDPDTTQAMGPSKRARRDDPRFTEDDDSSGSSDEDAQLEALQRQLQELVAKKAARKANRRRTSGKVKTEVKPEPDSIPTFHVDSSGVIDLTSD